MIKINFLVLIFLVSILFLVLKLYEKYFLKRYLLHLNLVENNNIFVIS